MMGLTNVKQKTSDQHQEATHARQKRDCSDTEKIIDYLRKADPFKGDANILRNIATGVAAAQFVNVDDAKSVGELILAKMVGKTVSEFVPRRVDQCVLMTAKGAGNGDEKHAHIDPALLFQRLLTVARRFEKDECSFFKYELCSHPLALFDKNCQMRIADKHEFAKAIASIGNYYDPLKCQIEHLKDEPVQYVLDGGALLHRINWYKNEPFLNIYDRYYKYVSTKYGDATIVFDGYTGASTKDMAHMKRSKVIGKQVMDFTPSMKITTTKEEFLSCTPNKVRFLDELGRHLKQKGLTILHATGDADLKIIQTAIRLSQISRTVLVGEDTDLLVLLLYYSNDIGKPIFLKSEPKTGKSGKIYDVLNLRDSIGPDACKLLLFAHAFTGCDTTSKPYGLGKGTALKLLNNNETFKNLGDEFLNPIRTNEEIDATGERAMILLYGGVSTDAHLDVFRYKIFQRKVSVATVAVQPEDIPPTSAAAKFHSRRTYHQVSVYFFFFNVIYSMLPKYTLYIHIHYYLGPKLAWK